MFNGIWLVASEPLTIGEREYQAGERFEISRIHSGALLVMGRATIAPKTPVQAPEPEPPKRRRGRPRKTEPTEAAETTEPPDTTEGDEVTATPTRRYQRRDLEAEE